MLFGYFWADIRDYVLVPVGVSAVGFVVGYSYNGRILAGIGAMFLTWTVLFAGAALGVYCQRKVWKE